MTNQTLNGLCPVPFLQENLFPSTGGFVAGRYCSTTSTPNGPVSCCLPCPAETWLYGDDVTEKANITNWLSVAILPFCVFILVSFVVLPAKYTNRTWFNICMALSCCCLQIGFVIPLGREPNKCYNDITPNDMYSQVQCAVTGSLLAFGGCCLIVWGFIRTVVFHLQVCWEVNLGQKHTWAAVICGVALIVTETTIVLRLSGVSYRLGNVCHINIRDSMHDYWTPLIVFSAVSLILQFTTVAYCIQVYVKSLYESSGTVSSGLPSYSGSVRTVTARQTYRRVRSILRLQWRGMVLTVVVIVHVILLAVVFIAMNAAAQNFENSKEAGTWISCLARTGGVKEQCLSLARDVRPNKAMVLAAVYLLSLVGMWAFLFVRRSVFVGWVKLFKRTFSKRHEFVSVDARRILRPYEMVESLNLRSVKSPEPEVRSPSPAKMGHTRNLSINEYYIYGRDAKYSQPSMSFSTPRPPSSSQGRDWDPQATFARSYRPEYSRNYGYTG